jgi:hypothetical protein
MPRYFFNVSHAEDTYCDRVGEELADQAAAWREATSSAGMTLRDLDGKLQPGMTWNMQVVDESGRTVYSIEIRTHKFA